MTRFYWVSHAWNTFNDPDNWSLESGGEGGAGVPGTGDIACFDANSFVDIVYPEAFVEIISTPNPDQTITSPDISCSFDLTSCEKKLYLWIREGASLSLESDLIGLYNLRSFGGSFYSNGHSIFVSSFVMEEGVVNVSGSEITIEGAIDDGCDMGILKIDTFINTGTVFTINSLSYCYLAIVDAVLENITINFLGVNPDALFWFIGDDEDEYLGVINNLTVNGDGYFGIGGD